MSSEPFEQGNFHIEENIIPIDFVSLQHPSIQHAFDEIQGVLNWASLYGILRQGSVEKVLSSESIPLYVVICYHDYEDEYFLMEPEEWWKMGDFIRPLEHNEVVNWTKEGF